MKTIIEDLETCKKAGGKVVQSETGDFYCYLTATLDYIKYDENEEKLVANVTFEGKDIEIRLPKSSFIYFGAKSILTLFPSKDLGVNLQK